MVCRRRLSVTSVRSWASVIPAAWMTPRIGAAPSASRLARSVCIASREPTSRATASTETPRNSSARMAASFCRVSASAVSLSQSRRGGSGVRPASIRRRAPRSASQPAISRPSAPIPPVIRYAASGRHRNGSRTGSPETGTRAGARNSPSRSTRMDLAGVRRTVDSADTEPAMSAPSGRSTRPPHNCGCSARITPAVPTGNSAAPPRRNSPRERRA